MLYKEKEHFEIWNIVVSMLDSDLTDDDPMRNAAMSVMEVTVMETPAFFKACAMRSGIGARLSRSSRFSRD